MLSVIVPAYNEGSNIEPAMKELVQELYNISSNWEVLVVDDGSIDSTYNIAKRIESLNGNKIKVLNYGANNGKGFALKYGFEHSSGDKVAFMDADMDLHPSKLREFISIMDTKGVDAVVGSKRHPESKVEYPLKRRVLSSAYYIFVRLMFNLDVKDTQVGLKLFKRELLEEIMPRVLVKKYAFDIELLANAVKRGYKIAEAPVELEFKNSSSVNWSAIRNMFVDTLAIAYRMHIKDYYNGNGHNGGNGHK